MIESPAMVVAQSVSAAIRDYGVYRGQSRERLAKAADFVQHIGGLPELGCLWEEACLRSRENPSGILWHLLQDIDRAKETVDDVKATRAAGGITPSPAAATKTEPESEPDKFRWDHVGGDWLSRKSADELREREQTLASYAQNFGEGKIQERSHVAHDAPGCDGSGGDGFRTVESRKTILEALKAAGVQAHAVHQSIWVTEFIDAGGTPAHMERLSGLCEGQPGKLVELIRDPHKWKGLLADMDLAKKEKRARSRKASVSEPVSINDLGPMFGEEGRRD